MAPTTPRASSKKRAKSRKTSETCAIVGTDLTGTADSIPLGSKLIEATRTTIAVADEYWEWMMAHRGTVDPDLDLEF